jgi:hypothetical protein
MPGTPDRPSRRRERTQNPLAPPVKHAKNLGRRIICCEIRRSIPNCVSLLPKNLPLKLSPFVHVLCLGSDHLSFWSYDSLHARSRTTKPEQNSAHCQRKETQVLSYSTQVINPSNRHAYAGMHPLHQLIMSAACTVLGITPVISIIILWRLVMRELNRGMQARASHMEIARRRTQGIEHAMDSEHESPSVLVHN